MHMQDYIGLETQISDFERKLTVIHAGFSEVCQKNYEPK
jgi:hypothetical protein